MPFINSEVSIYSLQRWLIREGETVEIDQDLAELTDGNEVILLPSPLDGTIIELCAFPGARVAVGDVLAIIEEE